MLSLSTISMGTTAHSPPSFFISSAKASNLSTLLAEIATLAPHFANTFANLYPKPEEAPVTRATWPDRSIEKFGTVFSIIYSFFFFILH